MTESYDSSAIRLASTDLVSVERRLKATTPCTT